MDYKCLPSEAYLDLMDTLIRQACPDVESEAFFLRSLDEAISNGLAFVPALEFAIKQRREREASAQAEANFRDGGLGKF